MEKKTIEIEVNATEATKALDKFGGTLEDVYGEGVQPLNFAIGELEDRLYEMAAAGKQGTAEFAEMSAEVGRMKKVIIDVDMQVDGLSMSFSQKLGGSLQGVASGFELVQGAFAAMGAESEEVEAALLKVQSAMAMAQGLQGIREAVPAFKSFGQSAITAFKGMTNASKLFAATGIGLIITLIALAVANFDKLKNMMGGVTERQKALNETMEDYRKGATDAISSTTKVKTAFELAREGVISKEEALKTYNETLGDAFGKTNDLAEAERLYNEKADAYVDAMAKRAQATALFEKAAEEQAKSLTAAQEDNRTFWDKATTLYLSSYTLGLYDTTEIEIDQQKKRTKAAKDEAEKRAKILEDEGKKLLKSAEKKEKDNKIKSDDEQKLEDEKKAKQEKYAEDRKAVLERIKQAEQDYHDTFISQQELEILTINRKYDELVTEAKKFKIDTTEIENARLNEINEINTKYAQEQLAIEQAKQDEINRIIKEANDQRLQDEEDFTEQYQEAINSDKQNEINAVNDKYFYLIETAKQYGYDVTELERKQKEELSAINDKFREEEKAKDDELQEARYEAVKGGLDAISSLAEAFAGESVESQRRAFKVQKAANIASATIDTYKAAQTAFASAPNPVLGGVFAAIAVAAGLANVKKIASTKFEGGGSSGGGGTSSAPSLPSNSATFNIVGNSGTNQIVEGLNSQPVQAYVVSSDVTTAQSLDRNKIKTATL